jgi:hypothetical protein
MTNDQRLRQIVEAVRKTGARPLELTETQLERLRHIVKAVCAAGPATVSAAEGDRR